MSCLSNQHLNSNNYYYNGNLHTNNSNNNNINSIATAFHNDNNNNKHQPSSSFHGKKYKKYDSINNNKIKKTQNHSFTIARAWHMHCIDKLLASLNATTHETTPTTKHSNTSMKKPQRHHYSPYIRALQPPSSSSC